MMPTTNWPGLSAEHFLQAASFLVPTILAERDSVEQSRELPAGLVEAMRDAGLFSLWLPKALGGPELTVQDFVRIIEVIATADGSVAWCAAVAACHSLFGGYLEEPAAQDIYGAGTGIVAGSLNPTGKAVVVPGGYQVSGQWSYGSGIRHSSWVVGNCLVSDGDMTQSHPVIRLMIFRKRDVDVLDTWHVSGLRGTGSHDFRVDDLFVPEEHSLTGIGGIPQQSGRLYTMPFTIFPVSLIGVPLGLARAAIDALIELGENKTPTGSTQRLKDKAAIQASIGRAEAVIRSARAFLFEAIQTMWHAPEVGAPSLRQRALVRLAVANVASAAKQVVDMMFESGGGTSLYEDCRLARCWRDAHAAAQHIGMSPNNFELGGRVLLGMEPGTARF